MDINDFSTEVTNKNNFVFDVLKKEIQGNSDTLVFKHQSSIYCVWAWVLQLSETVFIDVMMIME